MNYKPINFKDKFNLFTEHWSPKVIAEMNDYQIKLVKLQDEFVWHNHKKADEVFIVIEGRMTIEFSDGRVDLSEGEMFVVPRGVEHKPCAKKECRIIVIEPAGVVNTGEENNSLTAKNDVWI